MYKTTLLIAATMLALPVGVVSSRIAKTRVLFWSEQTEPREVYPSGISGELATALGRMAEFETSTAQLSDPDTGLSEASLNKTDVVVWFGHRKHNDVPDEVVQRVVHHIR